MGKPVDDATGAVAADPDEPATAWGARRARIRQRSNYRRLVLVTALFGTAAGSYPVTVLSASLPRIADDLGARDDTIAWVLAAPLLAFAVVTPIVGKVGDLYGQGSRGPVGRDRARLADPTAATAARRSGSP